MDSRYFPPLLRSLLPACQPELPGFLLHVSVRSSWNPGLITREVGFASSQPRCASAHAGPGGVGFCTWTRPDAFSALGHSRSFSCPLASRHRPSVPTPGSVPGGEERRSTQRSHTHGLRTARTWRPPTGLSRDHLHRAPRRRLPTSVTAFRPRDSEAVIPGL